MEKEKKVSTKTTNTKKTVKKETKKAAPKAEAKTKTVKKVAAPKAPAKKATAPKKTVAPKEKIEKVSAAELAKQEAKKKQIKTTKKLFNFYICKNIVIDLIMFAVGMFFIFKPFAGLRVCELIFSGLIIVNGAMALFDSSTEILFPMFKLNIIYGVMALVLGLFIIFNPLSIASVLTIMLGIWLIISGLLKIFYGGYLKYSNEESWLITIVIGSMTILFGVLMIINPFEPTIYMTEVAGIFTALYCVLDVTNNWLFRKRFKNLVEVFNK